MKKHLFLILISFSLFPLISSAGFIPLGPGCQPKDDYASSTVQKCQVDNSIKPTTVHLKWDINMVNPNLCELYCTKSDNTSCGIFNFKGKSSTGQSGFATSTDTGTKLNPKDDVFIENPEISTTYQMACYIFRGGASISDILAHSTVALSQKMQITGLGEPCEVPFSSIVGNLKNGQVAHITENNFRDWAPTDALDNLAKSKNLGSGDREDLVNYIKDNQGVCSVSGFATLVEGYEVFGLVKGLLNDRKPVLLRFRMDGLPDDPSIYQDWKYGHAMVGLEINNESAGTTTILRDGSKFYDKNLSLKVLDSNGPRVLDLKCEFTARYGRNLNPIYGALDCSYSYSGKVVELKISIDRTDIDKTNAMSGARQSYCKINSQSSLCQNDVVNRLEKEYPNIDNSSGEFGDGGCAGWADFVLKVGYLGDFVGKDFHPNDGQTIGNGCDVNHYPTPPSKTSSVKSSSWLASVWSAWGNLAKLFK